MKTLLLTTIFVMSGIWLAGCTTQQSQWLDSKLKEINEKALIVNTAMENIQKAETPEEFIDWVRIVSPDLADNLSESFKQYEIAKGNIETVGDTAKEMDWRTWLILVLTSGVSILGGGTATNLYKNRKG